MTAHPDLLALVAAIRDGDADSIPVLADWLDDHGDGRAAQVRAERALHWRATELFGDRRWVLGSTGTDGKRWEDQIAEVMRRRVPRSGAWLWTIYGWRGGEEPAPIGEEPSRITAQQAAERHLRRALASGTDREVCRSHASAVRAMCARVVALFPECVVETRSSFGIIEDAAFERFRARWESQWTGPPRLPEGS